MRTRSRTHRALPNLEHLDDRCLLSALGQASTGGYTPAEIIASYGLGAITFTAGNGATVKGDGSGQTIALIEEYHDPNLLADVNTFDAKYNLPSPSITVVDQAGAQTDNSWTLEESMDVEYAHAIAPAAKIVVVEAAPAPSSQYQEFLNQMFAEQTARNMPAVSVISMSWGFPEMPNESSFDPNFTTPTGHTGITFIASSGDYGLINYPATSPNVLAVGGTTLSLTNSGGYQSETAWLYSGGGYSAYEPEPGYQRSVQTTGARATPDVSFDGDPNTGVEIYATLPSSGKGSWQSYAGTSLGAPSWAGIIAIVDQGRVLAGKGTLDGPTQTLPALYESSASVFHNVPAFSRLGGISSGLSWLFGPSSGGANANVATGLGSPNGPALVSNLVSTTLTTPLTTSAAGPTSPVSGSTSTPVSTPVVHTMKHHPKVRHRPKAVRIKVHVPRVRVRQDNHAVKFVRANSRML